jgi:hypothetical protein
MASAVQGSTINLYVRDFNTSQVWKKVTCNENLSFDMSNDVNTKKTKCGVFKGIISPPDMKISGSGTVNFAPSATEYSYDQLQVDQLAGTKKSFRIQDDATVGTVIMINGDGYWTVSQGSFNNGETVDFTFTMEVDGTIGTSES